MKVSFSQIWLPLPSIPRLHPCGRPFHLAAFSTSAGSLQSAPSLSASPGPEEESESGLRICTLLFKVKINMNQPVSPVVRWPPSQQDPLGPHQSSLWSDSSSPNALWGLETHRQLNNPPCQSNVILLQNKLLYVVSLCYFFHKSITFLCAESITFVILMWSVTFKHKILTTIAEEGKGIITCPIIALHVCNYHWCHTFTNQSILIRLIVTPACEGGLASIWPLPGIFEQADPDIRVSR